MYMPCVLPLCVCALCILRIIRFENVLSNCGEILIESILTGKEEVEVKTRNLIRKLKVVVVSQ